LMADMLEATGSASALQWRIHACRDDSNNVQYRLAWAQTALKLHNPESAGLALEGLKSNAAATSTGTYYKLIGTLQWELRNEVEAEKAYLEALRMEPTNQVIVINLATVRLWSTNQDRITQARQTLQQLLTNSTFRPMALRELAADAARQRRFTQALEFSK